jgi:hypothetical protein
VAFELESWSKSNPSPTLPCLQREHRAQGESDQLDLAQALHQVLVRVIEVS